MDNKAAERIRPFLKAMESSIDSARQRRLKQNGGPAEHQETTAPSDAGNTNGAAASSDPPRLKARPKRAVPMVDPAHRRAV